MRGGARVGVKCRQMCRRPLARNGHRTGESFRKKGRRRGVRCKEREREREVFLPESLTQRRQEHDDEAREHGNGVADPVQRDSSVHGRWKGRDGEGERMGEHEPRDHGEEGERSERRE